MLQGWRVVNRLGISLAISRIRIYTGSLQREAQLSCVETDKCDEVI